MQETTAITRALLEGGRREQTSTGWWVCKINSRHGGPRVRMHQLKSSWSQAAMLAVCMPLTGENVGMSGKWAAVSDKCVSWRKRQAGPSWSRAKMQDGATCPLLTGSWNQIGKIYFQKTQRDRRSTVVTAVAAQLRLSEGSSRAACSFHVATMEGRNMAVSLVIYPSCTTYRLEYMSRCQWKGIMQLLLP